MSEYSLCKKKLTSVQSSPLYVFKVYLSSSHQHYIFDQEETNSDKTHTKLTKTALKLIYSYSSSEGLYKIPVLECASQVVCRNEFFQN